MRESNNTPPRGWRSDFTSPRSRATSDARHCLDETSAPVHRLVTTFLDDHLRPPSHPVPEPTD